MNKTLLKYSSLLLLIFSAVELAYALSEMFVNDFLSVEVISLLSSVFITQAQNTAFLALNAFIGCICGLLGLYMSISEAAIITYRRLAIGLMLVYIVVNVILLYGAASFIWIRIILLVVIGACYLYGAWDYSK